MTGMRFLLALVLLGAHGVTAAAQEPAHETPALRQRAEDLAGAASQRFTDILDAERAQPSSPAEQPLAARPSANTAALAPVWNWLYRSSQSYDEVVIAQLKGKDDWTTIVQRSGETQPSAQSTQVPQVPQPELRGWEGLMELLRYWLARANSAYRNDIVAPLRNPSALPPPVESVQQPPSVAAAGAASAPSLQPDAENEIRRQAEAADRQRRAEEAKQSAAAAEQKQRATAKVADDVRRTEEEKRIAAAAEERRRAQEEARARMIAEAKARREQDQAAEAKRLAEEKEAKKLAEAKRRAEKEAAEKEAEAKRAAAAAEKARQLAAEAEAKRTAEETRRQAEEADAAERRAVTEVVAEEKRKAEIEAEATRRSAEAAKAKLASRAAADKAGTEHPAPAPVAPAATVRTPPASSPATSKSDPAGASVSAAQVAQKENSAVASPPPIPEKAERASPTPSPEKLASGDARPTVGATPSIGGTNGRARRKGSASSETRRSHAHERGAKPARAHASKKAVKKSRRHAPRVRERGWHAPHAAHTGRRCACRCNRVFVKPRKHFLRHGRHAAPRHRVIRPTARGGRVTHRGRLYYIR